MSPIENEQSEIMELKNVLWLEDQFDDFGAYLGRLFMAGYWVDCVKSVSEAIQRLRENEYIAVIFDIKVLPGYLYEWIAFDQQKRLENPNFDPNLGFELLKSIFNPEKAEVLLAPPLTLDPKKFIVFSVVFTKTNEIAAMGIPPDQIIYKANSDLSTLPNLVKKIEKMKK